MFVKFLFASKDNGSKERSTVNLWNIHRFICVEWFPPNIFRYSGGYCPFLFKFWFNLIGLFLLVKMKITENSKIWRWLALIIVAALTFRVICCFTNPRIDKDSVFLVYMARDLAAGNFTKAFLWSTRTPPLYPLLMGAGKFLGMKAHFFGRLISVLAGGLLVIPVFFLAGKLMNYRLALLSAFLAATHPYLIRISADIMRDSLFYLLFFTGLAFAVYATDPARARLWYVAGIFTGFAVLTRSEGVEIFLVLLCWLALNTVMPWLALLRARVSKNDTERVELGPDKLQKIKNSSWFHGICCFCCFLFTYLLVTVSAQIILIRTPSTWAVVDYRIISLSGSFITLSKDEVVKEEEH